MHDELIFRLRRYSKNCIANKLDSDFADAVQQAADAIEKLAKESERWQAEAKDWYLAYMGLLPIREESEEENG